MEYTSLAVKYRPKKFQDIIGQKAVSVLLKQMVRKETVPNVLLFEGVKGSGKTTSARVLAAALNCAEDLNEPCTKCISCVEVFEGNSLSVREIDASSHGLVDDIRRLQDELLYQVPGKKSVVLLDEVQGLSKAASNALLRTLEEPPEGVLFILITTESQKVMGTVRSRCMSFLFRRVSPELIAQRLRQVCEAESLSVELELLTLVASHSDGSLRDALMTLDQLVRAGISTAEEFRDLHGDFDFGPKFIASLFSGRHSQVFKILEEALSKTDRATVIADQIIATLADVLTLKSGGTLLEQGTRLAVRQALASKLEVKRITSALRALWDLKIKLRSYDESRSEVMYLMATVLMEELVPTSPDNLTVPINVDRLVPA